MPQLFTIGFERVDACILRNVPYPLLISEGLARGPFSVYRREERWKSVLGSLAGGRGSVIATATAYRLIMHLIPVG